MHVQKFTLFRQHEFFEIDFFFEIGPRVNTVCDLWGMIWQEGITQIVMLTNLQEEARVSQTDRQIGRQTDRQTDI